MRQPDRGEPSHAALDAAPEIERKFLVHDMSVLSGTPVLLIRQFYLLDDGRTVVRINQRDGAYRLTLRENLAGVVRQQFTVAIPIFFGEALTASPAARVSVKRRHTLLHGGRRWTVDVWDRPVPGLALAEVELAHPREDVDVPPWCGREVTGEPEYYDHAIAARMAGGERTAE